MNARTFILTALLTAIVTPSFAQSFRETNPLSDSGVRTLASWAESQIDENGRLRDYTPTDEPLYTGAVSDGQSSTVQESLQKIAEMMPCEEGEEWKLQQANLDDDAMAAAEKIEVDLQGRDDRTYISAKGDLVSRSIGRLECRKVINGVMYGLDTNATIIGNRRTIVASGHYNTDNERGIIYQPHECSFNQYDVNGNLRFKRNFHSVKKEPGQKDADYLDKSKFISQDWSVMTLDEDAPSYTVPVKVSTEDPSVTQERPDIFIIAHQSGVKYPKRKLYSEGRVELAGRGRAWRHFIDVVNGGSGALLLSEKNGQLYAYGIHIMGSPTGNMAVRFNDNILKALEENVRIAELTGIDRDN